MEMVIEMETEIRDRKTVREGREGEREKERRRERDRQTNIAANELQGTSLPVRQ